MSNITYRALGFLKVVSDVGVVSRTGSFCVFYLHDQEILSLASKPDCESIALCVSCVVFPNGTVGGIETESRCSYITSVQGTFSDAVRLHLSNGLS